MRLVALGLLALFACDSDEPAAGDRRDSGQVPRDAQADMDAASSGDGGSGAGTMDASTSSPLDSGFDRDGSATDAAMHDASEDSDDDSGPSDGSTTTARSTVRPRCTCRSTTARRRS